MTSFASAIDWVQGASSTLPPALGRYRYMPWLGR
jgi:hypothetical protein